MSKLQAQVIAFHAAIGQPINERPAIPEKDRIRLRAALVIEEAFEFLEALYGGRLAEFEMAKSLVENVISKRDPRVDLTKAADALGDLDWAVESTRLTFGIDGRPIAEAIFQANMKTVDGSRLAANGIQGKPTQWEPPNIEAILRNQGKLYDGGTQ